MPMERQLRAMVRAGGPKNPTKTMFLTGRKGLLSIRKESWLTNLVTVFFVPDSALDM
jgi:hypothetical protein